MQNIVEEVQTARQQREEVVHPCCRIILSIVVVIMIIITLFVKIKSARETRQNITMKQERKEVFLKLP